MKENTRGGARPGAGRPAIGNSKAVSLRISEEAVRILSQQLNKNAYVSEAILYYHAHKAE